MRQVSEKLIAKLKEFEGFRDKAYRDQAGVLTIGYGHTGTHIYEGMIITTTEGECLLKEDLSIFETGVTALVTVSINDNQFDALVDFAYNLGLSPLKHSSLLKLLNTGNYKSAANEFLRWCYINGQVSEGLLKRRQWEKDLFMS